MCYYTITCLKLFRFCIIAFYFAVAVAVLSLTILAVLRAHIDTFTTADPSADFTVFTDSDRGAFFNPLLPRQQALPTLPHLPNTVPTNNMIRIFNLLLPTSRASLHHGKRLVLAIFFAPLDHGHASGAEEPDREGGDVLGQFGGFVVVEGVGILVSWGSFFGFTRRYFCHLELSDMKI